MTIGLATLAALVPLICLPAAAATLTLDVPGAPDPTENPVRYRCGNGAEFSAEYVTIGASDLAVVPVEGQTLVFARTLAASGVRYASGFYVWWTKGPQAALYDERTGSDEPMLTCAEQD